MDFTPANTEMTSRSGSDVEDWLPTATPVELGAMPVYVPPPVSSPVRRLTPARSQEPERRPTCKSICKDLCRLVCVLSVIIGSIFIAHTIVEMLKLGEIEIHLRVPYTVLIDVIVGVLISAMLCIGYIIF